MTASDRRVALPGESGPPPARAAAVAEQEAARPVDVVHVAELALLTLLGGLIGRWFDPVFDDVSLLGPCLVAAAICAGLELVLVVRSRWTPTATALVSVVAFTVVATVLVQGLPTPSAMLDVVREIVAGPRTILTSPLPVSSSGLVTVVPIAVVWVAVWAAAELALRVESVFAPLVPIALAAAVPALLGGTATVPATGSLTVLLVLAGALTVVRTLRSRSATTASVRSAQALRRRRALLAVPVLLAVAVLAPLATRALGIGEDERYDPRSVPAGEDLDLRSPLARVDAVANATKETTAFNATGTPGIARWRLAVLDRYDGTSWTSSATYAPAGSVLEPSDEPAAAPRVRAAVAVDALGTRFVPTPGTPLRISGIEVRHDRATGTLFAPEGLDRGDRYAIEALQVDPDDEELRLASADRAAGDQADLDVPGGAPAIRQLAGEEVEQRRGAFAGTTDYRAVRSIQAMFADQRRFRLTREAISGESLRQLNRVLGVEGRSSGGDAGDAGDADDEPNQGSRQQLTAAMAVMLRTQGLPTRVVVGYRTPSNTDGRYEVTNRDATAWVEVRFAGYGWVPFDAVPTTRSDTPTTTTTTTPPTTGPATSSTVPTPSSTTVPADAVAGSGARHRGGGDDGTPVVAYVLGAGALALAVVGLLAARRPLRRWRRRRAPDPARRLDGAWVDVRDRLARSKVPLEPSMTVTEVRDLGRARVDESGRSHLDELAELVSTASWSGRPVLDADADAAWRHADAVAEGIHGRGH